MNYLEAQILTITKEDARLEIIKHNLSFVDFLLEVGDKIEYTGSEILDWLGY